jgi:hypothetical protein
MRKRITVGDCWNWDGAVTSSGYGAVAHNGRTHSTHKLAYELLVGPVPDGLQIDHLCRNKLCCNPAHLEPVTGQENIRRRQVAIYGEPQGRPSPELAEVFSRFFGNVA